MKKIYYIMGKYGRLPREVIDETDTLKDANYLLGEYRLAFWSGWQLSIKSKIQKED